MATGSYALTQNSAQVKAEIEELKARFVCLKMNIIKSLQMRNVDVRDVIHELDTLTKEKMSVYKLLTNENLRECEDYKALFKKIKFYWNHESPMLLVRLSKKLKCSGKVLKKLRKYQDDLYHFRVNTLLTLFCNIKGEAIQLPKGYTIIVAVFESNIFNDMTLEDLDQFMVKYANHYMPCNFAIVLKEVKADSFMVSFLVPQSVSVILSERAKVPERFFRKCGVRQLDIAGSCVYNYGSHCSLPVALNTKALNSVSTTLSIPYNLMSASAAPYSMEKQLERGQPLSAPAAHYSMRFRKKLERDQPLYYLPERKKKLWYPSDTIHSSDDTLHSSDSTIDYVRPSWKNKQCKISDRGPRTLPSKFYCKPGPSGRELARLKNKERLEYELSDIRRRPSRLIKGGQKNLHNMRKF